MRESLQRLCDSFIENRDIIKGAFRFENSAMYAVCANIFTARGQTADLDRLDMCKQLIKEKTGIFSNFRGVVRMPIICMLAAQDNPSSLMEETLSCYEELKGHFFSSSYLALVAFLMADLNDGNAADRAARGRAIYKRMSKEHPFLTSSEDSVFAVLLAYSEKSDDQLIEDMEKCYDLLRRRPAEKPFPCQQLPAGCLARARHVRSSAGRKGRPPRRALRGNSRGGW